MCNQIDLQIAERFYRGERARILRQEYGVEPWLVVARVRARPDFYELLGRWRG